MTFDPSAEPRLSPLAALVREGDRDRFEASLFAPPEKRERLFALYAFNLEIARTPWRVSEPQIGAIRLRWWLDAIAEIYDGAAPRRHHIVDPLAALIRDPSLAAPPPREAFEALIEARGRDLDATPMESRAAFEKYVADTSASLVRLGAWILTDGRETPEQRAIAEDAGYAFGAAALLRATPALARRGRLMLPPAEGEALDVAATLRGETTDALRRAVHAVAEAARKRLRKARGRRRALAPEATPALLAGWRADAVLAAAIRPKMDAFVDLGPESPFRRRSSLIWRGATGRW